MTVARDTVVSLHYTLTDDDGNLLDSSEDGLPLEYLHGNGNLLPKLEALLEGRAPGERLEAVLSARDGYGEYDPALVQEVPRADFDTDMEIAPGMRFQAEGGDGAQLVTVTDVSPTTVTIDANHELAGKSLHFALHVVDVRAAQPDELATGMVGGGCSGGCGGCASSGGCGTCSGCR